MKVLFSVLSYYPSFITNESINIGILFHNVDTDTRLFEITTNWARIRGFDDEVDTEYLKLILKGIREEIRNDNLFKYKEKFELKKYANFFVNELKFSDIAFTDIDKFEEFVSQTKKMFLRFDYEKADRPSQQEQLIYIKNLMKYNNVEYSNKNIKGSFKENINFDYIIDGYAFKIFSFENKNLSKQIFYAKSWAFTANEVRNEYKTIFIYDSQSDSEYFNSIMNILNKSAYRVMDMQEAVDFILKLKINSEINKPLVKQSMAANPQ